MWLMSFLSLFTVPFPPRIACQNATSPFRLAGEFGSAGIVWERLNFEQEVHWPVTAALTAGG